jgi:hypothetical protein
VAANGRYNLFNPSGTAVLEWRVGGNAIDMFGALQLTNRFASPMFKLGDGTSIDTMQISWDFPTDMTFGMRDTNNVAEFGGVETLRIGGATTGSTLNTTGDFGIDTTANQITYFSGGAVQVIDPVRTTCFTKQNLANADDNFIFWMADRAVTVTGIGCRCVGTCSGTLAAFALEDNDGNALTHSAPTCSTTTTEAAFTAVTAANALVEGEGLAFDETSTQTQETNTYTICVRYTTDRQ